MPCHIYSFLGQGLFSQKTVQVYEVNFVGRRNKITQKRILYIKNLKKKKFDSRIPKRF